MYEGVEEGMRQGWFHQVGGDGAWASDTWFDVTEDARDESPLACCIISLLEPAESYEVTVDHL